MSEKSQMDNYGTTGHSHNPGTTPPTGEMNGKGDTEGQEELPGGLLDYEEILNHIGHFGKSQVLILLGVCMLTAYTGYLVVLYAFVGFEMKYRCAVPYCEKSDLDIASYYKYPDNHTYPDFVHVAIPESALHIPSKCSYLSLRGFIPPNQAANTTETCLDYIKALEGSSLGNGTVEVYCGYKDLVFDHSVVQTSLVQDYSFVCDHRYLIGIVGSLNMVGMLVGSPLVGILSDRFGRLTVIMWCMVASFGCIVLSTVIHHPIAYAFFRFLQGIVQFGIYAPSFVLLLEHLGTAYFTFIGIPTGIPFSMGEGLLGLVAYFVRDWKTLQLTTLAWAILLALFFIMPESPRWLIAKGRYAQVRKDILKFSRLNGKVVPLSLLDPHAAKEVDQAGMRAASLPPLSLLDLFRTKIILLRSLNMFYQWFAVCICYYGLSYSSTSLGGSPYSNFILSAMIEAPGILFCVFIMNCWGRKPILMFCQLLGGLSCIAAALMYEHLEAVPGLVPLQIFLSLSGKFFITGAFSLVYVYTSELFPTRIRTTAVGACSCAARFGGIAALSLNLLSSLWVPAPMIIMGSVSAAAGVLAAYLPETMGQPLPETMEDSINIGKTNSYRSLCTFQRLKCWILPNID